MASKSITVRILGDARGLTDALGHAGDGVGRFARNVGTAFALGGAAVATGAAALGVSAVRAASDLNETLSKTGAIFDEAAAGVVAWSETTASALGISQTAALDYASSFGGALKEIGGLSEAEAARTAQGLTQLTADLGSFFNASNEEVAGAIGSALTGEFEPLRRYNVIINEAMLQQKALELGLSDGTGALDAQAKQAATLALIMEQTGDAQGDFARTSDGMANQTKLLTARFDDLKTELGQRLLPVVNQVFAFLLDNAPQIEAVAGRAFEIVGDAVGFAVNGFQAFKAAFSGEGITSDGFTGVLEAIGVAARIVFDFFVENWPAIQETISAVLDVMIEGFQMVADWVAEHWPEISATITTAVETISEVISGVVDVVTALWEQFGDDILNVITILAEAIVPLLQGTFDIISGIFDVFAGLFTGDWSRLWDGVQSILSGAWTIITTLVSTAFDLIVELVGAAMSALLDVVTTVGGDVIGWFANLGGDVLDAIGDIAGSLYSVGADIIDGLWEGLKDKWESVKTWFGNIADAVPGFLKGPLGINSPSRVFAEIGRNIMDGLNVGLERGITETESRFGGFALDLTSSVSPAAGASQSGTRAAGDVFNIYPQTSRPWLEEVNELSILRGALVRA